MRIRYALPQVPIQHRPLTSTKANLTFRNQRSAYGQTLIMATQTISAIALVSILMLSKSLKVECNQNLTFMFMTSFGRFGLNSSGVIPAADIALEAINADPNILPGYDLVYDRIRDSEVS